MGKLFFRYANSRVGNLYNNGLRGSMARYFYPTTLMVEFNGIVNEIVDDLLELVFVHIHRYPGKCTCIKIEFQVFLHHERLKCQYDTSEQRKYFLMLFVQLPFAGFYTR